MPERVKGLLYVKSQSPRGMGDLIREFRNYNWLSSIKTSRESSEGHEYRLTGEGLKAYNLSMSSPKDFRRLLARQMHNNYIIPGWFIHRLWSVNPDGQGEVVIPSPPLDWRPSSKKWETNKWNEDLHDQTIKSLSIISKISPSAFPIGEEIWVDSVKLAWDRLSSLKPRRVAKSLKMATGKEKEKMKTYSPRQRLKVAMQEAAVKLIFSNQPPNSDQKDFSKNREPLYPRTYMVWCSRLEALELIFYTDVHPLVPGRLIFPTSVFRTKPTNDTFEELYGINNINNEKLYLHQPKWEKIKKTFFEILVHEHQRIYPRVGSLYVPLLDVRDEVCRQLRLSAVCFENLLEKCLRESLQPSSQWSIAVETDIREDQRSAHRLIRRPVWIAGAPHSLIAITEIPSVKGDKIHD